MGARVRVLIVEDSDDDALLLLWELKRGGFEPVHARVDTRDGMVGALGREQWDLIVSDYAMPHFSGLGALTIARSAGNDIPFIVVSGAIGEDVAEMYAPLAEEKNVSFTAQFTPGIGARGDRNMIAQALANLVDNAIKYVPERGAVTLSLALIDGKPTFSVADTGPGVPEAFKGKVLERLFRLEQSRTSPGSGLGLSLVNAVARSHGMVLKLLDNHPGLRVTLAFPDVVAVPIAARPQADPELAPEPAEDPVRAAAE